MEQRGRGAGDSPKGPRSAAVRWPGARAARPKLGQPGRSEQTPRRNLQRVGYRDNCRNRDVLPAPLDLAQVDRTELGALGQSLLSQAPPGAPPPNIGGDRALDFAGPRGGHPPQVARGRFS